MQKCLGALIIYETPVLHCHAVTYCYLAPFFERKMQMPDVSAGGLVHYLKSHNVSCEDGATTREWKSFPFPVFIDRAPQTAAKMERYNYFLKETLNCCIEGTAYFNLV